MTTTRKILEQAESEHGVDINLHDSELIIKDIYDKLQRHRANILNLYSSFIKYDSKYRNFN